MSLFKDLDKQRNEPDGGTENDEDLQLSSLWINPRGTRFGRIHRHRTVSKWHRCDDGIGAGCWVN